MRSAQGGEVSGAQSAQSDITPTQVVPYYPGCELMLLVEAKQISGLRMYFLWTESPVLDEMLWM